MKKTYKYSELKGKLKVGMKVSADPSKNNYCQALKADGSNEETITKIKDKGFYINGCFHGFVDEAFLMVDLEQSKNLDCLQKGDYVKRDIYIKKVLARLEDVFLLSEAHGIVSNWDTSAGSWYHIEELKKDGFIICDKDGKELKSEETTEVSMEQVSKAMNIPLEKLRIKKD